VGFVSNTCVHIVIVYSNCDEMIIEREEETWPACFHIWHDIVLCCSLEALFVIHVRIGPLKLLISVHLLYINEILGC